MKKYLLLLLIACIMAVPSIAQLKSANKKFDQLAYATAIKKYQRVVAKNDANVEAWTQLGKCYRYVGDYSKAEQAFGRVVNGPVQPEVYLFYAEALMQNQKYGEALTWLKKYQAAVPSDDRAARLIAGIDQIPTYKTFEEVYKITKININTNASEISPIVFNGGIVFASNRDEVGWVKKTHRWNNLPFYHLYHAKGQAASFQKPTHFANELKTKLHDGPVSFSKIGTQIYFTRNNMEDGKVRKDAHRITRLKIFYSNFSSGEWGIEVPFAYNSDTYSCAHPSLSVDGQWLYFASDMPGGKGGMDIWKCRWNGMQWESPINLGDQVNTKGNEVFPHIGVDGNLYFSSDGQPGLGGLDIYSIKDNGSDKPQNLGIPMNSASDDFGFCLGSSSDNGYFTTNRGNNYNNDDIYYFIKKCVNVEVLVRDEATGVLLPNTQITVIENGQEKQTMLTDSSAKFTACLNPLRNYEFIAKRANYTDSKSVISNTEMAEAAVQNGLKRVDVVLKKNIVNLHGRVMNKDTKETKSNQLVTLYNQTTQAQEVTYTDSVGNYAFDNLLLDCEYEVRTSFKDCGEAVNRFNTHNVQGVMDINSNLELLCKGAIIQIENIYYDYNKSDIRSDAAMELDKVVDLLNQNPTMKIELRSHTDARGKDSYNMKLSESRAKAAVSYMISKGIDPMRLVAKGYGETQLLNGCKNDVECTEEEHGVNRRTEFKILEM